MWWRRCDRESMCLQGHLHLEVQLGPNLCLYLQVSQNLLPHISTSMATEQYLPPMSLRQE